MIDLNFVNHTCPICGSDKFIAFTGGANCPDCGIKYSSIDFINQWNSGSILYTDLVIIQELSD